MNRVEFKTIEIPRGTILFRGIYTGSTKKYDSIFSELIGHRKEKYHTISPTLNSFFYPAPYVSDSVQIYDIHIMYVTQYPIELLLLMKPSDMSRANKDNLIYKDIFQTCSDISEKDKCGYIMPDYDPCFTDTFMQRYPQIDGYIGIAEQDASYFMKKYSKMIENSELSRVKQIIPSLLTDSRDIIAIPEIVLHPLRFRNDECFTLRERLQQPDEIVRFCTKFRAQYNYFPLLYFTNKSVYTFNDLRDKNVVTKLMNENRIYDNTSPPIYDNIDNVLSKMISSHGYNIDDTPYRVKVDTYTGFYRLSRPIGVRETRKRVTNVRNFTDDLFNGRVDTVLQYKKDMIRYIPHNNYIDSFLHNLHINGLSAKKRLVVNRGATDKVIYKYKIDKVLDMPQLNSYRERRIINNRKTQKNVNNKSRFMFIGIESDNNI